MIEVKKNNRLLVGASLVIAAFGLCELNGLGPFSIIERWSDLTTVRERLEDERRTEDRVAIAEQSVEDWKAKSLSSSPTKLSAVVQQKLIELSTAVGAGDLIVEPAAPKRLGDAGYIVRFVIRGAMRPQQCAEYMDAIHAFDTLRKVTRIDILPASKSRSQKNVDEKRVTIEIEFLALHGAKDTKEIPDRDRSSSFAKLLQSKPIFQRYASPPPPTVVKTKPKPRPIEKVETKPVVELPPPPNLLKSLRYVASFSNEGEWQAWLYDSESQKQYTVNERDKLVNGAYWLRVTQIDDESIEVQRNGARHNVGLGELLIPAHKEL